MDFKTLRLSVGMTQQDIADRLSISRTAVTMWEIGAAYPRAVILPTLASLLSVTEGDIIAAISSTRKAKQAV